MSSFVSFLEEREKERDEPEISFSGLTCDFRKKKRFQVQEIKKIGILFVIKNQFFGFKKSFQFKSDFLKQKKNNLVRKSSFKENLV